MFVDIENIKIESFVDFRVDVCAFLNDSKSISYLNLFVYRLYFQYQQLFKFGIFNINKISNLTFSISTNFQYQQNYYFFSKKNYYYFFFQKNYYYLFFSKNYYYFLFFLLNAY